MKKILLLASLLVIGMPGISEDVIEEISVPMSEVIPAQEIVKPADPVMDELPPRWTEFCEAGYENAVFQIR